MMSVVSVGAAVRVCLTLAALKIACGIAVFIALRADLPARPIPVPVYVLHIAVFAAVGSLLVYASQRDRRALYLGVSFCLIAGSFADPISRRLPDLLPASLNSAGLLISSLQPEGLIPCFLWLFFQDFPRGFGTPAINRIFRWGVGISLVVGIGLFVANLALFFVRTGSDGGTAAGVLSLFERKAPASYFWVLVFLLELPPLPLAIWKARQTAVEERRRLTLFLTGLAIGSLPMMIDVILEILIPEFSAWMSVPSHRFAGALILYPLLLTVPVTTAYSVLVQRVLDARLIIRQALRYALARYSVLAVAAIPFLLIIFYVYRHRSETVSSLLSGNRLMAAIVAGSVCVIVFQLRSRIFNAIDRRYFRENYDSRKILSSLVERSRAASSVEELAALLKTEIDRALHVESVAMLAIEPTQGLLRAPNHEIRSLSTSSPLVALTEGSTEPLDIDLEDPKSLLRRLALEDREWLAEGAFRLLVSLVASDGSLVGLLALGGKKSELRFSREDRMLLQAIAASVALTLENRLLSDWRNRSRQATLPGAIHRTTSEDEVATECHSCGSLRPPRASRCDGCGGATEPVDVPYVLLGKFRLERRIGAGGMGVVYRAADLLLGRVVAIKTLPKASPEYAMRLRREARAMATVVHPNLALIFGAETWRGTPMLVVEYLDGGTLADRLRRGRCALDDTIHLGIMLASALERTHAAGILHRDIKPSNIGYTGDGTPKLLDFGLAHVLEDTRAEARQRRSFDAKLFERSTISLNTWDMNPMTPDGYLVGTPVYLSPERVNGAPSDPSIDLWALALVLYESLAGLNPAMRATPKETLEYISRGVIPDIRERVPDCPEGMAHFLADALAREKARRPSTAADFGARLARVGAL
jgi:GAF domain-containing protein